MEQSIVAFRHVKSNRVLLRLARTCALGCLAATTMTGCFSGPGRVGAVDIDAEEVSKTLIIENDKDGNASLSEEELTALGAIRNRLDVYDHNGDGQVDAAELSEQLMRVFDGRTGLLSASCRVTRNGRALEGAIVYFVPLPVFGDDMPVAGAVTQRNGIGQLSILPDDLPKNAPKVSGLIRPGLYFVEVKHPSLNIPQQYNVNTTLGQEVTAETAAGGPYKLDLKF